MEHQDWHEVVLSKNPRSSGLSKQQQLAKAQRSGTLVTEKKCESGFASSRIVVPYSSPACLG